MSAAFGLVHSQTGLTYYMNCEHPWSILYRDGHAEFIEHELMIRKLGMPDDKRQISIRRLELKDGDTLVLGSDGRDDLEIDGNIDADESRFVRIVEETQANIELIPQKLSEQGKLSDDLSLISIAYKGKSI